TLDPLADALINAEGIAIPDGATLRICDPACGSGRFLLAAAMRLAHTLAAADNDRDLTRVLQDIIRRCIYAVDRDPIAIEMTRFRLWQASGFDRDVADALRNHCRIGDALLGAPVDPSLSGESADEWCEQAIGGQDTAADRNWFHWQDAFREVFAAGKDERIQGFDAVIGNPPFLSQLSARTSLDRAAAAVVRAWSEGAVTRYADTAAAFAIRSLDLVRPGGRLALVQPLSFLASNDTRAVRSSLISRASLASVWVSTRSVFPGADVLTCAPVFIASREQQPSVASFADLPATRLPQDSNTADELRAKPTWSFIIAGASGVPRVQLVQASTFADRAEATADFRDQYYGLDGFLIDQPDAPDDSFPRLVTSGLIDPAECRWGSSTTRVLKRRWDTPRIDREAMDERGSLGPWMASRMIPKLMVATQTRVLEVFADEHGTYIPSTPVLTVVPRDADDLWLLGAALTSPVCSAIALREFGGAALTSDAIKLAARQLLTLPLPENHEAWREAGESFRAASNATSSQKRQQLLRMCATASLRAYAVPDDQHRTLMRWWSDRLPARAKAG
ncbi:MAG: N-6 DNA methylase, partial [Planctomycetota bacterium]